MPGLSIIYKNYNQIELIFIDFIYPLVSIYYQLLQAYLLPTPI